MNKDKWKTIIGIIGMHLHNHPDDKKHKIEFTTDELKYIYEQLQRPSQEEVCAALTDHLKKDYVNPVVFYENGAFKMAIQKTADTEYIGEIAKRYYDDTIMVHEDVTIDLLEIIARFYKKEERS